MISMNMRPPRLSDARALATLPAEKARMRNNVSRNMGLATRVSTTANTASKTRPPMISVMTNGLVQPMV
jgi:hypothetical protein